MLVLRFNSGKERGCKGWNGNDGFNEGEGDNGGVADIRKEED